MSNSDNTRRQLDEQTQPKPRPQNAQPLPSQNDKIQGPAKERPAPTQKPTRQGS